MLTSMPADINTFLTTYVAMVLEDTAQCGLIVAKKSVFSSPHNRTVQSLYALITATGHKRELEGNVVKKSR